MLALPLQAGSLKHLDESELESAFVMSCRSLEEIKSMAGQDLTATGLEELILFRKPIINIIKNGQLAIDSLMQDPTYTGYANEMIAANCSLIVQMQSKVQDLGCLDLETHESIKSGAGFAICPDVVKKFEESNQQ